MFHDRPVEPQVRDFFKAKRFAQVRQFSQGSQIVSIWRMSAGLSLGKVVAPRSFGDASLKCAFNGITGEVERAPETAAAEKDFGILKPFAR